MKKVFAFAALMLAAVVTVNATTLFEETLQTKRGDTYIVKAKTSTGEAWPLASQWWSGYEAKDASKNVTGNQYDFPYEKVTSYGVTVRGKKLNGDEKNSTVLLYFSAGKAEAENYVTFEGGLWEAVDNAVLHIEIGGDQQYGGDLSAMIVKINDNALTVPATTLGDQLTTKEIKIALPNEKVEKLYFAFNNATAQRVIPRFWITDEGGSSYQLQVSASTGGSVNTSVNGRYLGGTSVVLSATPDEHYHFMQWSDGNTENPRTITITNDISLTAEFSDKYTISTSKNEADWGSITGGAAVEYQSVLTLTATANYGYHFAYWLCNNNKCYDNPLTVTVLGDATYVAYFEKNTYSIQYEKTEGGYIKGNKNSLYLDNVTCTAIPDRGCYFVKWGDGDTSNPRTITLTKDTTMWAVFDYFLSGKCGKDNMLAWSVKLSNKALTITGKGELSDNYTYGTFIESLTIGNEVSVIGKNAFNGCYNLKNVVIGSGTKVLEEAAFYYCSAIKTITCYSQRPPTVNNRALEGLDYGTIVYVPKDYMSTYIMHDAWGLYDVRSLEATSAETNKVNVMPEENTADIVWPVVTGAVTYELVIKDKDGNVVVTLIFDADGKLTQIAFNAPARHNALQQDQVEGFRFVITGLESNTQYKYQIFGKDDLGNVIDAKEGTFKTTGIASGINEATTIDCCSLSIKKILHNGQIYIVMPNGNTYSILGNPIK